MLIVFIRGIFLYFLIIFSVRLMGKRQIGDLTPNELVITILVSNIATLSLEDTSVPMFTGVVPILTLVCLDVIAGYTCMKSRKVRNLFSGKPKVVISNGVIDQGVLKELRYTVDDLMSALRTQSIFDITQVQFAVVETTGAISALLKAEHQPVTPKTLAQPEQPADPPQAIISDGDFIESEENKLRLDRKEITKELKRRHLEITDVFLCTMDPDGSLKIIKKQRSEDK